MDGVDPEIKRYTYIHIHTHPYRYFLKSCDTNF